METATRQAFIRWMIRRDLPSVLAAEDELPFDQAWCETDLLEFLRERNHIGMVVEIGETVIGHMCYGLAPDHIQLRRLVVAKAHRGKGYGRDLLDKLESKLSRRRTEIRIDVPDDDLPAQLWLSRNGYRATVLDRETYRFAKSSPLVMREGEHAKLG
jgi:ribosomal protein S18 acetylase RimI-like enzyme